MLNKMAEGGGQEKSMFFGTELLWEQDRCGECSGGAFSVGAFERDCV